MKFLVLTTAAALLGLSACNAPQGDEDGDERTEQSEQDEDEDDDD